MYELVVTHQFQPVHKGCTVGTTKPFVFKFLSERQDLRFREFVPTPRKKQNEKKKCQSPRLSVGHIVHVEKETSTLWERTS